MSNTCQRIRLWNWIKMFIINIIFETCNTQWVYSIDGTAEVFRQENSVFLSIKLVHTDINIYQL